jgi:hypothetical protein
VISRGLRWLSGRGRPLGAVRYRHAPAQVDRMITHGNVGFRLRREAGCDLARGGAGWLNSHRPQRESC